jgi:uncharacterized protein (TIGR02569 family)
MSMAPSSATRAAYRVTEEPVLLRGGFSQTAWRAGDVVLKKIGHDDEHAWLCEVYDAWPASDVVRVPMPLRTADGAWSHDGWGAHTWLPGHPAGPEADSHWFRATADAFHAITATLDPPAFVATRDDAWSHGDRVAWEGAAPVGSAATLELLSAAEPLLGPIDQPVQVVHGDLAGNVLRAPGRAPAVIDWPPYIRPAGWALAVAAMDAVRFGGADVALLDRWSDIEEWDQLLLRALIYRVATRGHREIAEAHPLGSDGYVEETCGLRLIEERL